MNWKTIFMNISSDYILIDTWDNQKINLPRDFVEKSLWKELIKLYREIWFENVIVLNWPGGFTNLRVGTLCLNILNTLLDNQVSFYDISKIDLYKIAYKKWFLSKYWVIYIWQKRNVRLWDFEKNEKIGQYSFDELKDLKEMNDINNIFIESVKEQWYYPEWMDKYIKYDLMFNCDTISLIDNINNKFSISFDDLNLNQLKSISPNYMMEPSITINK